MTAKERCRCGMTATPCQNLRSPFPSKANNGYSGRCPDCAAGLHASHKGD